MGAPQLFAPIIDEFIEERQVGKNLEGTSDRGKFQFVSNPLIVRRDPKW